MKLNKVQQRIIFLAPAIQAGWDQQSSLQCFQQIPSKQLGQGSFGKVYKRKHKFTGKQYAKYNMLKYVQNQIKIMYQLNHPNIVKLYSHFQDQKCIYLIQQYVARGQLYKQMFKLKQKKFNVQTSVNYVYQLVLALQYIHSKKIIHRDIKPENILLTSERKTIKLTDFGWSNFISPNQIRDTFCGTIDYLSPQMNQEGSIHNQKVDIWAVGILLFQLLSGKSPFRQNPNDSNQIVQTRIKVV